MCVRRNQWAFLAFTHITQTQLAGCGSPRRKYYIQEYEKKCFAFFYIRLCLDIRLWLYFWCRKYSDVVTCMLIYFALPSPRTQHAGEQNERFILYCCCYCVRLAWSCRHIGYVLLASRFHKQNISSPTSYCACVWAEFLCSFFLFHFFFMTATIQHMSLICFFFCFRFLLHIEFFIINSKWHCVCGDLIFFASLHWNPVWSYRSAVVGIIYVREKIDYCLWIGSGLNLFVHQRER